MKFLSIECWSVVLCPQNGTLGQTVSLQLSKWNNKQQINCSQNVLKFILLIIAQFSLTPWLFKLIGFNKVEVKDNLANFICLYYLCCQFCLFVCDICLFVLFVVVAACLFVGSFVLFFVFWTAEVFCSSITHPFSSIFSCSSYI